MKKSGLETIQSWNACVYHFTCVSSRGDKWFENSKQAEKKNYLQTKADHEELKRFIRKWGYFGHEYKPRYNVALVIDIDTGVEIDLIKQIEPYFSKIIINDQEIVDELIHRIDYETHYFANKRWNYTNNHWKEIKYKFKPIDFKNKIIYKTDLNSYYEDVIVKISMLDLLKLNQDGESQSFVLNCNDILTGLLNNADISKGDYEVGIFKISVNNLVDINKSNLESNQYLIPNIEEYIFT